MIPDASEHRSGDRYERLCRTKGFQQVFKLGFKLCFRNGFAVIFAALGLATIVSISLSHALAPAASIRSAASAQYKAAQREVLIDVFPSGCSRFGN
ncbi:MAG TPA: hypothetical protein DDZ43_15580 [Hyphomonadaceae bacterium]|nr:hypothetical protein [Hyphomonadaceae bacterium]HBJ94299.1 hypothetical protein [Hyphomonadaceae bacterium]